MLGFQGYKRRVQVVGAYAEFPARFNAVDLLPVSRVVDIVEIKAGDAVFAVDPVRIDRHERCQARSQHEVGALVYYEFQFVPELPPAGQLCAVAELGSMHARFLASEPGYKSCGFQKPHSGTSPSK